MNSISKINNLLIRRQARSQNTVLREHSNRSGTLGVIQHWLFLCAVIKPRTTDDSRTVFCRVLHKQDETGLPQLMDQGRGRDKSEDEDKEILSIAHFGGAAGAESNSVFSRTDPQRGQ